MFMALWSLVAAVLDLPVARSLIGAFLIGFGYGLYEEFYVQGRPGAWLRRRSAVFEIAFNTVVLVVLLLVVMNLNHLASMRYDRMQEAYQRLPVVLPVMTVFSAAMVTLLRVIGFVGAHNLLHLVLGTYRRPVLERRLFLFLDMKNSTVLAERLGPLKTRELIGKFFYDASQPVYDHGGEIHRFTGDGMVVTWKVSADENLDYAIETLDEIVESVRREAAYYERVYGHVPGFRAGLHCGDIVVCEEGDMKRAIGFYGDSIHIAARLEGEAKTRGCDCIVSAAVANHIARFSDRLQALGLVEIRGISEAQEIYALSFVET
jgi:adenylate cyclase